jgi:hypothetical protein
MPWHEAGSSRSNTIRNYCPFGVSLAYALETEGFECKWCATGGDAIVPLRKKRDFAKKAGDKPITER